MKKLQEDRFKLEEQRKHILKNIEDRSRIEEDSLLTKYKEDVEVERLAQERKREGKAETIRKTREIIERAIREKEQKKVAEKQEDIRYSETYAEKLERDHENHLKEI